MNHSQRIAPCYTFGLSTTGNIAALNLAVATVLQGTVLPAQILLRFEGSLPAFDNFYLAQLSELARIKGVEFSINVAKSAGVRRARDWLMSSCRTAYLWMGDDDAIYAPHCLAEFEAAVNELVTNPRPEPWGFVVGNKPDLNNRRGYVDFSTTPISSELAPNHSSFNQFYSGESKTLLHEHLDTGNVVFNVESIREKEITFEVFDDTHNSGGEDTLVALCCGKAGLQGYFRTRADAYHLEKPEVRFNEFAARKNMLRRECAILGVEGHRVDGMMPWVR